MKPHVRPALPEDLPAVHRIHYELAVEGAGDAPPQGPLPHLYGHELDTGRLLVAELDGRVEGFGATVERGDVVWLAELFVRRAHQGAGLGAALLAALAPGGGRAFATSSSDDPAALALYARAGLRPLWPVLALLGERARLRPLAPADLALEPADPDDPALVAIDARLGGRARPRDQRYWREAVAAVPLWVVRGGARVGAAWVQLAADEHVWRPDAASVGPVLAADPDTAGDAVRATVTWALARREAVRVFLPGPHPALAALLGAGLRVRFVDSFCASGPSFCDPTRYLPSGGTLF